MIQLLIPIVGTLSSITGIGISGSYLKMRNDKDLFAYASP